MNDFLCFSLRGGLLNGESTCSELDDTGLDPSPATAANLTVITLTSQKWQGLNEVMRVP